MSTLITPIAIAISIYLSCKVARIIEYTGAILSAGILGSMLIYTGRTNEYRKEWRLIVTALIFMLICLITSCTKKTCAPVAGVPSPATSHGECNINGLPLAWVDVNNPNNVEQSPIPIALGGRNIAITFSDESESVDYISVTNYVAGMNLGNKLPEAYRKLSSFTLPAVITSGDWKITVRTKKNEYYGAFRVP